MLNQSLSQRVAHPSPIGNVLPTGFSSSNHPSPYIAEKSEDAALKRVLSNDAVEWSEQDVVYLHWRLLMEVDQLADPAAPLDEKFDILRWVFTESEKDVKPFSFVSCLRVVGCSPLSPVPYCGYVDVEEVRDRIWHSLKTWLPASLERYPDWVGDAVIHNPQWIEARLAKNPQWINEQIKRMSVTGDLFT